MTKKPATSLFRYVADKDGKRVRGSVKATSASAAHVALLNRGLRPSAITPKKSIWQFEITTERVPRKEILAFTRQLSVFVQAGIPITDALVVIAEETPGKLLRRIIADMVENLRAGDSFATVAASHPEAFPHFYVGILESAELTGNLDAVLSQLASYMQRDLDARAKIKSALIYPSVVAAMSVVTVGVLAVYVLPRFVTFFTSLHATLPLATRLLIAVTHGLTVAWPFLVLGAVALVTTFVTMRRVPAGRALLDRTLLRVPVIGDLTRTAILERVFRILASMLRAGVDLPRAMTVTADSANNARFRAALEEVRADVMEGQGLSGPLTRTGLFPGAARQMIRIGEETGTLDRQLEVAAEYYDRELEVKLDRATALFEPAVIVVMGIVVGFVAVALISAMYGIYNQVHVQ